MCSVLDMGGAERHWATLLPALQDRGLPVRLIALKRGGRAYELLGELGVPTRTLGSSGPATTLARFPALLSELWPRPRVVVTWGFDAEVAGGALAQLAGAPHVIHWHAGAGSPISTRQAVAFRLGARLGAGVIGVSRTQIPELRSFGFNEERIRIGPPGVPKPNRSFADRRAARSALNLPEPTFVAAVVARLSHEKRIDRFVSAIATLAASGVDVRGVVVGDGPAASQLAQMAGGLGAPVDFVGYQAQPADYMIASDVVCLTSDREALPLTVLEAAACERPTVAMDIGGVRELVDDETGILVAQGDVDAFTRALGQLVTSPGRAARLGAEAHLRWQERWSLDAMADGYYGLLTSVTGPPASWPENADSCLR